MEKNYNEYKQLLRLRLWLKVGLAQEKKGAYDSAAASYRKAIKLTEAYFDNAEQEIKSFRRRKERKNTPYHFESLNDLKLFYQPHFCLAYLQEKSLTNAHANLALIERFIKRLEKLIKKQSSARVFNGKLANLPLFYAECLKKAGDLFYFKGFGPTNVRKKKFLFLNRAIKKYYMPAIKILLRYYFSTAKFASILKSMIQILFKYEEKPTKTINLLDRAQSAQVYYLLAVIMSDMGDALLSKLDKENSRIDVNVLATYLEDWKRLYEDENFSETAMDNFLKASGNRVIMILSCYLLAARLLMRAAMHKECAFEYEKILRVLRYWDINMDNSYSDKIKRIIELLKEHIFEPGQKYYHLAYSNVHRTLPKTIVDDISPLIEPPKVEIFELYWLRLKDKLTKKIDGLGKEEIMDYVKNISQEDHFDNALKRIDHLTFKTKKLSEYFRAMLGLKTFNSEAIFNVEEEKNAFCHCWMIPDQQMIDKIETIIKDGLFCCYHSISLREVHSNIGWWLHRGRAYMHLFMAHWTRRYKCTLKYVRNSNGEQKAQHKKREIEKYVGAKNIKYIDYEDQLQQALKNFHKAKETHTGGKAYKTLIQRMYYLNDDFNNRALHFDLARERFELRCDKVQETIKYIKKLIEAAYQQ